MGKQPTVHDQGWISPRLQGNWTQFGTVVVSRGPKREAPELDLFWPIRALSPAPRDPPENELALSSSPLGMTCLATSACILWSEFLNGPLQVQQFSPRWRLFLSIQGLRGIRR
jgi:hypothetical protein